MSAVATTAGSTVVGAVAGAAFDLWIRHTAQRESRAGRVSAASGHGRRTGRLDQHLAGGRSRLLVVPVLSALGCLAVGLRLVGDTAVVPFMFFVPVLIGLAVVDFHTHRLPNAVTLPSLIAGVLLVGGVAVARGEPAVLLHGLSAALILVLMFAPVAAVRGGLGAGDVKAAAVIGLFVGSIGIGAALVAVLVAAVAALVGGAILLATHRVARGHPTPFGPYLAVGALVGILAGPALFGAYVDVLDGSGWRAP